MKPLCPGRNTMLLTCGWLCLAALVVAGQTSANVPRPPVIDVHWHAPAPNDLAAQLSMMDSLNVKHAVMLGISDQLAALASHPAASRFLPALSFPCESGRMVSFGAPCGSVFPPLETLRESIKAGRVKVLGEVNAQYLGIAPNDTRLEPYYALAEELDVPVGIHLGIGPPGVAYEGPRFPPVKSLNYRGTAGNPLGLEDVLVRHPKLRLYVMHAAWPFRSEMLYLLYMHPQLHADLSVLQWAIPRAAYYSYLRELADAGFGARLMYGSDGNAARMKEGVEAILAAEFLTKEQQRAILYDNAALFFRLKD